VSRAPAVQLSHPLARVTLAGVAPAASLGEGGVTGASGGLNGGSERLLGHPPKHHSAQVPSKSPLAREARVLQPTSAFSHGGASVSDSDGGGSRTGSRAPSGDSRGGHGGSVSGGSTNGGSARGDSVSGNWGDSDSDGDVGVGWRRHTSRVGSVRANLSAACHSDANGAVPGAAVQRALRSRSGSDEKQDHGDDRGRGGSGGSGVQGSGTLASPPSPIVSRRSVQSDVDAATAPAVTAPAVTQPPSNQQPVGAACPCIASCRLVSCRVGAELCVQRSSRLCFVLSDARPRRFRQ
jgi:hypothetical protein